MLIAIQLCTITWSCIFCLFNNSKSNFINYFFHSGLKPLYKDSYQQPSDPKMTQMYLTPVDTPFVQPAPGPKSAYSAPGMYNTEYKNVGSGKPITV